ncbi:MAG: HAD-IC family P-type ATPase [Acidimicrobiales bacterium]
MGAMTATPELGLSSAQVADRRSRGLGNVELESTSRPLSQIIRTNVLTRFNAILASLLLVIIVVGPFQDTLFGIVLVLNTLIGIAQELRAKRTLDRLALLSAPVAHVCRDAAISDVGVGELVIDDVIELRPGDQVPLDGEVLGGTLEVDESLLSGESDPIPKGPGAEVLSGSFVSSGSGAYRVTKVGSDSYAQRIAGEAKRFTLASSELRDGVNQILRWIQWALVPVSALLIVSQLIAKSTLADAIRGCVAGISAMIPEGLILLTSLAFAVAVLRLARRRVLVQELPAVEGLARVDVLCVDKTGTLTRGGIEVEGLDELATTRTKTGGDGTGSGPPTEEGLGALAASEPNPNATLAAIVDRWPAPPGWTSRAVVPFSSARKWSAADFGTRGVWVLGAPDVLLAGSPSTAEPEVRRQVETAAAAGRRVVLVARTTAPLAGEDLPAGLEPVALVRLTEQVRTDAGETLAFFGRQGVAVKVISGDHPTTVSAIASAVGVPNADQPVDAQGLDDRALADLLESRSVFGRVTPRQKRTMVAALKEQGHTVAMTGDGVNDVLALKDADIGIAMGSGSPATRGVAQLVLLDDSFSALPPVIDEGRRVMANVERVANLFLTKTVYATLIALAVGIARVPYPFLPRQLTIVSSLTIGIPAFFLALLPNPQPFRPGFVNRVVRFAGPCGVVAGVAALTGYLLAYQADLSLDQCRTTATIVLVACGLWVLSLLSRPFSAVKLTLLLSMVACFAVILLVPAVRDFFALELPPSGQLTEAAVLVVVAGIAFEVIYRTLRTTVGLVTS